MAPSHAFRQLCDNIPDWCTNGYAGAAAKDFPIVR